MLTEIYIEALLVDGELADQVWAAWIVEKLTDGAACIAWSLIAGLVSRRNHFCFAWRQSVWQCNRTWIIACVNTPICGKPSSPVKKN